MMIRLEMPLDMVNAIVGRIAKFPYEEVHLILRTMESQVQAQILAEQAKLTPVTPTK